MTDRPARTTILTSSRRALLAAGIAAVLAAASLPGLIEQARDVDVLLYSAAAVRGNAFHALPYESAWIEKGPLAMGLFQGLFLVFGNGNLAAIAGAWLVLALAGAALAWALASACGGGRSSGPWAALLFAMSVGTVGGTLNTEVPAAVAGAGAVLVWMRGARRSGSVATARTEMARPGTAQGGATRTETALAAAARTETARAAAASVWPGALAGALAGGAFLCRQNGGALWPLLVAAEGLLVFAGARAPRAAARSALAISAGFVATVGAAVGLYALRGTLPVMLFCTMGYNATIYIAATKIDAARLLAAPFVAAKNFLLPVWTMSALGLAGMAMATRGAWLARRSRRTETVVVHDRATKPAAPAPPDVQRDGEVTAGAPKDAVWEDGASVDGRGALVLLPVVALVAIGLTASLMPGLRLFSHYFAMPLPFWAALGGVAIARLAHGAAGRTRRAIVVGAIVLVSLGAELARRPWMPAARALREWIADGGLVRPGDPLLWPGRDPLAAKAARWLRGHSAPDDTVFVWGMRPHVAIYAQRRPATRFVTCTFLTGLVPWERVGSEEDTTRWIVPGSWDLLARDLDAERPRFIVDASQDHLFAMGAYPPSKYPVLQQRLDALYEPVFDTGGSRAGAPFEERLVIWQRKAR